MARTELSRDEVMAMLEDHPRRIAAATKNVTPARLRRERVLGTWSAVDILAHLRACADARGEIIPDIANWDGRPMRAIDPRRLIEETDYHDLDFATSLAAFVRQRARLVKFLKALPPSGWLRGALFTGFGTPRERSVLFYGGWIVRHEQAHVKHIERYFRPPATRDR